VFFLVCSPEIAEPFPPPRNTPGLFFFPSAAFKIAAFLFSGPLRRFSDFGLPFSVMVRLMSRPWISGAEIRRFLLSKLPRLSRQRLFVIQTEGSSIFSPAARVFQCGSSENLRPLPFPSFSLSFLPSHNRAMSPLLIQSALSFPRATSGVGQANFL